MQDSAVPAGAEASFLQCGGGVCVTACLMLSVEWVLHDRAQFIMDLGQPCHLWMERGNQAVNTKQSIKVNTQKHKIFLFSIYLEQDFSSCAAFFPVFLHLTADNNLKDLLKL